jgi:hypothetical protein
LNLGAEQKVTERQILVSIGAVFYTLAYALLALEKEDLRRQVATLQGEYLETQAGVVGPGTDVPRNSPHLSNGSATWKFPS